MSNLRTIKIRGDSTENWELANPILEYKEMACEFADNGTFFKIGNGIDSWNNLAYVSTVAGSTITDAEIKQKYENNPNTNAFTDDDKSKLTELKTTVPQAEAEVGTSTVVRAWTAQRVRQAITAWWNTIGTAFGKTLLGSADASDARQNLGLGTTATKDVGTAIGNVMVVGEGTAYGYIPSANVDADWSRTTSNRFWGWKLDMSGESYFYGFEIFRSESFKYRIGIRNNKLVVGSFQNGVDLGYVEAITTGNILTTTGQSTLYPMTQKAVTDELGGKVDKEEGKGLSDENYTLAEKTKLENLPDNATLADLTDVDFGTPTDGQVLTYDAATQKSKFADPAGGNASNTIKWGTISGSVTLTDADSGKTFIITSDAVITIGNGLSAGWNVAFVPDDSKDNTVYDVTLSFDGSGSVIGSTTTIKGVCSLALTPIGGLFAAAGAIE